VDIHVQDAGRKIIEKCAVEEVAEISQYHLKQKCHVYVNNKKPRVNNGGFRSFL
jgi:hypothetical protein